MLFAIGEDDVGAGFRQAQGDGRANAATSAGDDGVFTRQRKTIGHYFFRFNARLAAAAMKGALIS